MKGRKYELKQKLAQFSVFYNHALLRNSRLGFQTAILILRVSRSTILSFFRLSTFQVMRKF